MTNKFKVPIKAALTVFRVAIFTVTMTIVIFAVAMVAASPVLFVLQSWFISDEIRTSVAMCTICVVAICSFITAVTVWACVVISDLLAVRRRADRSFMHTLATLGEHVNRVEEEEQ